MPKVYLSPPIRQVYKYPNGGDEQFWMNKIVDHMAAGLVRNGIAYGRTPPNMGFEAAIRESNQGRYQLHLALHSKQAPPEMEGKRKGANICYYEHSHTGRKAAETIWANYRGIYPEPELVYAVSATTFVELTGTRAPAVLVETAYHDNPQDEIWLTGHVEEIAENLVKSLCEIFGMEYKNA